MNRSEEKIIGKIIHNKLSIEWMRYNMFSQNNIYKNIPILVFRLNEIDMGNQIAKLKECVDRFEGELEWKVFKDPLSKKGNYLLTLSIMEDIREKCFKKGTIYNEQECLENDQFKLYCEQAIRDIPSLAKHIDDFFGKRQARPCIEKPLPI